MQTNLEKCMSHRNITDIRDICDEFLNEMQINFEKTMVRGSNNLRDIRNIRDINNIKSIEEFSTEEVKKIKDELSSKIKDSAKNINKLLSKYFTNSKNPL